MSLAVKFVALQEPEYGQQAGDGTGAEQYRPVPAPHRAKGDPDGNDVNEYPELTEPSEQVDQ